ncbi:hypothetical protein Tco_1379004 [Tanacetum coccineum]
MGDLWSIRSVSLWNRINSGRRRLVDDENTIIENSSYKRQNRRSNLLLDGLLELKKLCLEEKLDRDQIHDYRSTHCQQDSDLFTNGDESGAGPELMPFCVHGLQSSLPLNCRAYGRLTFERLLCMKLNAFPQLVTQQHPFPCDTLKHCIPDLLHYWTTNSSLGPTNIYAPRDSNCPDSDYPSSTLEVYPHSIPVFEESEVVVGRSLSSSKLTQRKCEWFGYLFMPLYLVAA